MLFRTQPHCFLIPNNFEPLTLRRQAQDMQNKPKPTTIYFQPHSERGKKEPHDDNMPVHSSFDVYYRPEGSGGSARASPPAKLENYPQVKTNHCFQVRMLCIWLSDWSLVLAAIVLRFRSAAIRCSRCTSHGRRMVVSFLTCRICAYRYRYRMLVEMFLMFSVHNLHVKLSLGMSATSDEHALQTKVDSLLMIYLSHEKSRNRVLWGIFCLVADVAWASIVFVFSILCFSEIPT